MQWTPGSRAFNKHGTVLQYVIVAFIVICLALYMVFGIAHLERLYLINTTLDLFGLVISLFLMRITYDDINRIGAEDKNYIAYYYFLCSMGFGLFFDFCSWTFEGNRDLSIFNSISNTLYYLVGPTCIYLFGKYIAELIKFEKSEIQKSVRTLLLFLYIVTTALIIVNIFTGIYFVIDDSGRYVETKGTFYIHSFLISAMLLTEAVAVVKSTQSFGNKILLLSYMVVGLIASFVEIFFYGLSITYAMNLIIAFVIYSAIQSVNRQKIVDLQNKLIFSQLNPHFICNSMLSIRRLVKKDSNSAVEAIDHFISYLRGSIDLSYAPSLIPVSKEISFIKDYLDLERVRFGTRIQYEVIEEDGNYDIPAFAIHSLVENSIRHGIRKKEDGSGRVTIHLFEEKKWHVIEITDDGVGFEMGNVARDEREHVGIFNAKWCIESLLGGRLDIDSTPGEGTVAKIYIPKKK